MKRTSLITALVLALVGCSAADPAGLYTEAEIDYFLEVAVGTEFGQGGGVIRKWTRDIGIKVSGEPTDADLQTLDAVVSDLNELVDTVEIRLLDDWEGDAQAEVIFAPSSEFSQIEPNYVEGNLGFFWVRWSASCTLTSARVLISTDGVTQRERSHLIREELTQSLGLMRDSYAYPASIFYQDWTDVTDYAPIDETVIEMLYRPDVTSCMSGTDARRVLTAAGE